MVNEAVDLENKVENRRWNWYNKILSHESYLVVEKGIEFDVKCLKGVEVI